MVNGKRGSTVCEQDKKIAALLRFRRKDKNLTQREAANRAGINIRHYQQFEGCGRSLITASFSTTMGVLTALEIEPYAFIETYVKVYEESKVPGGEHL